MKALKIHVERAVRPLCASPLRKDRMREELLAHLSGIYEQECERLGACPEALARAQERFGDPAGLSKALQEAVPWLEKFVTRAGTRFWTASSGIGNQGNLPYAAGSVRTSRSRRERSPW